MDHYLNYIKYKKKYIALKVYEKIGGRPPNLSRLSLSSCDGRPNYGRQRSSVEQVEDIHRKELKPSSAELKILEHIKKFIPDDSKKHFVELTKSEIIDGKTYISTVTVNGTKHTQFLLFTPDEIRQIINIFKILAKFGIYEKDMNPENFIIKGDTIVKIDFGGIENQHKTLFEARESILNSDPTFKAKLLKNEDEIKELETVVLDDTNLYGITEEESNPSKAMQKFIYGTMFLQLKNKIDIESFTLENPVIEQILNAEYKNPTLDPIQTSI
jgi:hypothetical protein